MLGGYPSLDDLIRPHQERRWDSKTEGPGGLQVDDELEQDWLLNCEISRLGPLQDPVDVGGGTPLEIGLDDTVGHQATTLIGHRRKRVHRRQSMASRKLSNSGALNSKNA